MEGLRELGPISVVVTNHDGEAHLAACLDAVFLLRGAVDEVIVVDNASRDRSVELVERRFQTERSAAGARRDLRVLALARNDGPCPARNAGLRAARNRWVLALDNDAVVAPDALEKLALAARSRPDAVIVQPRSVLDAEPSRVHYDGGAFHYAGLIALRNFYRPLAEAEGEGVVAVDCAVSVALLCDRQALLDVGGFDEGFFILYEDLDLSYRLRLQGHTILSVEDALVRHRGGTPGISFRDGPRYPVSRVFLHSRNRWLFVLACYRTRTLVAALPGILAHETFAFALAVVSGGLFAWLSGKRDLLRRLPEVRAKRRRIGATRRRRDRDLLVGGPLTVTPALRGSALRRGALAALDRGLRAWWWVGGRISG